jgi:CheY-like chemotaxis protein
MSCLPNWRSCRERWCPLIATLNDAPNASLSSNPASRPTYPFAVAETHRVAAAISALVEAGRGCRDRKLQRAVFTLTARAATNERLPDEEETAQLITQAQVVASAALATGYEDLVVAATRLLAALAADPNREPFTRNRRGTSGLGSKILLIHPDPDFCAATTDHLEATGYRVATEEDGATGLARVRTEHPALVVCDLDLPLTPGEVVILSLRLDPATAHLPIVVLTNTPQRLGPEHRVEAILRPPIPLDDLTATIELFAPTLAL